jgi:hypothetical protein
MIEEDEMGRACSMNGEKRNILWESQRKEGH